MKVKPMVKAAVMMDKVRFSVKLRLAFRTATMYVQYYLLRVLWQD